MAIPLKKTRLALIIAVVLVAFAFPTRKVLPTTTNNADAPPNNTILTGGLRLVRQTSPGESHSFQVLLQAHDYLRLSFQVSGANVMVVLRDPNAREHLVVNGFQSRLTPFSVIVREGGTWRIEVRSVGQRPGNFELAVEDLRAEQQTDETTIAAEAAMNEGEKSRREWTSLSLAKAIERFEMAASLWESLGRQKEAASAYRLVGETWFMLDEPQKSLPAYSRALSLSRNTRDPTGMSGALNGLGYIYLGFGEHPKARKFFDEALALSRSAGDVRGESQSLNNLGELCYAQRDLSESLVYYRQALSLWERLDDLEGQALAYLNFGYTYNDLSDAAAAQSALDRALSHWQSTQNRRGEGLTVTALGHLYSKMGDKQRALDSYRHARELFEPIQNRTGLAFVYNGLGYVYEELGETDKALESYLSAYQLFTVTSYQEGQAGSLYKIGQAYFALGNYQEALNYYKQSRSVSRRIGDKRMEGLPVKLMGQALAAQGKHKQALSFYLRALQLNRAGSDHREAAYTLREIGGTYHQLGEHLQAKRYYGEALGLHRTTGDRFGECGTLNRFATLHRALNDLSEAHSVMETALNLAESLRTNVVSHALRASYFATVREAYQLQIDILMQMHKQHPDRGHDIRAFELSERARARSFLESLNEARAGIRDGANIAVVDKQKAIEEKLDAEAALHSQLLAANKTEELKASTQRINDLTAQYDQVSVEIRLTNPRYAALTQPQPLTLSAIQHQVLDDDSVLLEYALGTDRSYVWAVTRKDITSHELPPASQIEKAVHAVYQGLTANQALPGETFEQRQIRINRAQEDLPLSITQLSMMLVDPIADKLGHKHLLIVPDGALQYIPFQILTSPADAHSASGHFNGRKSLLDSHELTYEASASTLASLSNDASARNAATGDVVVLADPVFEADDVRVKGSPLSENVMSPHNQGSDVHRALDDAGVAGADGRIPRLLASKIEADAIMSVIQWGAGFNATGFEATRDKAMKPELAGYRIVHFATHGLLNARHPELSGIVLSLVDENGKPQNGFLRLHDIHSLKLPVDLVVLSACNTGLGKDVKGEGLIGLTRAFMYAGASSVVASLWKVDDEATAELMKHFYTGMLQEELSPSAALRKAQLELSKQKRWQSPYYWSGFTIQGQYRQPERLARNGMRTKAAVLALTFATLFVAFMGWKQRRIRLV